MSGSAGELRAITTVYSYYFPEVRGVISELAAAYPHEVFLRSITPGLDGFHEPILEQLVAYHRASVPHLAQFPHRYPTSGSEEGIREYLSLLALRGVRRIAMWQGDYEGYREVARTRGIETVEVPFHADPAAVPPAHWMLSNPSARDGNIVPAAAIAAVAAAGHRIFYDLSYLGSTAPHTFDVAHPAIDAVAISFSKPYGLFYYRIGFLFAREAVPALYGNKWFKNVFSLLVAQRLMERLGPRQLPQRYRPVQEAIVAAIRRDTGLPVAASDALLLAHLPASEVPPQMEPRLARFRRADGYRMCLTPYYLEREAGAAGV